MFHIPLFVWISTMQHTYHPMVLETLSWLAPVFILEAAVVTHYDDLWSRSQLWSLLDFSWWWSSEMYFFISWTTDSRNVAVFVESDNIVRDVWRWYHRKEVKLMLSQSKRELEWEDAGLLGRKRGGIENIFNLDKSWICVFICQVNIS